jgi:hypothetical protein
LFLHSYFTCNSLIIIGEDAYYETLTVYFDADVVDPIIK